MANKEVIDQTTAGEAVVETNMPEEQMAPPALDLKDLAIAMNLLNVGIKRGAYETNELRGVLDCFEKLEAFLAFQAQLQAANQAAQEAETGEK